MNENEQAACAGLRALAVGATDETVRLRACELLMPRVVEAGMIDVKGTELATWPAVSTNDGHVPVCSLGRVDA